ncbi:hypothetical protein QR680_008581 [Steinernema hermaphroditum]|uniref:Uncharacterized protein n=1 Tax=Steinernema hermaphroditum TaxID=289476 RepID=A0AA39IJ33_9BILA|nr:hypothetical protein QR680_008581 [Steinernema hermaphroditum]
MKSGSGRSSRSSSGSPPVPLVAPHPVSFQSACGSPFLWSRIVDESAIFCGIEQVRRHMLKSFVNHGAVPFRIVFRASPTSLINRSGHSSCASCVVVEHKLPFSSHMSQSSVPSNRFFDKPLVVFHEIFPYLPPNQFVEFGDDVVRRVASFLLIVAATSLLVPGRILRQTGLVRPDLRNLLENLAGLHMASWCVRSSCRITSRLGVWITAQRDTPAILARLHPVSSERRVSKRLSYSSSSSSSSSRVAEVQRGDSWRYWAEGFDEGLHSATDQETGSGDIFTALCCNDPVPLHRSSLQ